MDVVGRQIEAYAAGRALGAGQHRRLRRDLPCTATGWAAKDVVVVTGSQAQQGPDRQGAEVNPERFILRAGAGLDSDPLLGPIAGHALGEQRVQQLRPCHNDAANR
jgi:hypothetical protein